MEPERNDNVRHDHRRATHMKVTAFRTRNMQELAPSNSTFQEAWRTRRTIEIPPVRQDLYRTLQQEVDLGVQALKRESAEMAITFFQSALQKMAVDDPFYDHLVHNLLQSYKVVIEKLLDEGEWSLALDFLRAALRLGIRGEMTDDTDFLRK